jgi:CP family cyanate transporter-like MFS transporter
MHGAKVYVMRISPSAGKAARSFPILAIGIVLIGANLRAPITSLGPVLPDISRALQLDGAGAGVLNALPLLVFALLSLLAPAVGRRFGLERMLGAALLAILVGTVVRSLALPGAIWSGTLLLSSGIAFGNVLLPGLVKRDFPTAAARLIGLYAAAMAGTAGLAAGLAVPIAQLPGANWRWSIGGWALLALAALLAWLPQLRKGSVAAAPAPAAVTVTTSPWRHPIGWQVALFFAFHSFVFYAIVDWFATYAAAAGIGAGRAGAYLLVYQVVAVATNLGTASLIKRCADQVMLGIGCGLLLLAGCAGLLLAPVYALAWLVCAGLGAGVAMVVSLSLFALRTRDHHQAAALSGMAQFVGYAGAALGPLLVGVLHDLTGGWTWPFALLVLCSGGVTVCAGLAGRRRYMDA